jgi:enterochelin esterase-like enzyme/outer membrane protein assembly factor BamB
MHFIGTALGVILVLLASAPSTAGDWPGYRGASADGISTEPVFSDVESLGLELEWRRKIGSGYSGIAIAGGRVVTMFSDGTSDVVAAFDESHGSELWRQTLEATYRGHDGSHDGPLATPLIHGGRVFGITALGRLFALEAETGEQVWSVDLPAAHEAVSPIYGFSTSPMMQGGLLIVQVGGKNVSVAGFDPATGEEKWTAGSDTVNYQSPVPFTLGERSFVLAAGLKQLLLLDGASGEVVAEYEHGGGGFRGARSITPVPAGDGRVFLAHAEDASAMVRIRSAGEGFVIEPLWEHRSIHNSYTVPVYHEGHLYGYSNRFLTCVDAETGEPVWRSRQPGDGFVTLVDDHLVILTKQGSLHLAPASEQGYREVTGLELFADLAWTAPSFANGHLYLRSLGELVRVGVGHASVLTRVIDRSLVPDEESPFGCFLSEIAEAEDKRAVVDAWIESSDGFPIVEAGGQVHFVYRGPGEDLAIAGDMIGHRQERPMKRVPGTDLFYYSATLEPDARISYLFIRDYEEMVDPLNPRETVTTVVGKAMEPSLGVPVATPISWLAMPEWKPAPALEGAAGEFRGRLETHHFASEHLGAEQAIEVYLPAGYDESDRPYPVAIIHGGAVARERGSLIETLDRLGDERIEPLLLVFVGSVAPLGAHEPYAAMVADELIPYLDQAFRTIASREGRAHVGADFAGFAALYCAFSRPGDASRVGTHSAVMLDFMRAGLEPLFVTDQPFDVYMDWGTYDFRNPDEAWDMVEMNRDLTELLRKQGFEPAGGESRTGPGWSVWRHRVADLLAALFPAGQR